MLCTVVVLYDVVKRPGGPRAAPKRAASLKAAPSAARFFVPSSLKLDNSHGNNLLAATFHQLSTPTSSPQNCNYLIFRPILTIPTADPGFSCIVQLFPVRLISTRIFCVWTRRSSSVDQPTSICKYKSPPRVYFPHAFGPLVRIKSCWAASPLCITTATQLEPQVQRDHPSRQGIHNSSSLVTVNRQPSTADLIQLKQSELDILSSVAELHHTIRNRNLLNPHNVSCLGVVQNLSISSCCPQAPGRTWNAITVRWFLFERILTCCEPLCHGLLSIQP